MVLTVSLYAADLRRRRLPFPSLMFLAWQLQLRYLSRQFVSVVFDDSVPPYTLSPIDALRSKAQIFILTFRLSFILPFHHNIFKTHCLTQCLIKSERVGLLLTLTPQPLTSRAALSRQSMQLCLTLLARTTSGYRNAEINSQESVKSHLISSDPDVLQYFLQDVRELDSTYIINTLPPF